MKKFLIIAAFLIPALSTYAQKGNNYIGVALEGGLPTGDFGQAVKFGFGGSLRALLGVGKSGDGQVTFTTGYTGFKVKYSIYFEDIKATYSIIPLLFGYRHNFNGLFLEPNLGVGIYGLKATALGGSDSDSQAAFTWALGAGYAANGFEFGVRYQSGKIDDADAAFSLIGLHVGYNFKLGGGRK